MSSAEDFVRRPIERNARGNASVRATPAPTILVVDDDPGIRTLTSQVLQTNGFRVLIAGDVGEAMQISDHFESKIELLLTDVMLPTGNGIMLARSILAKRPATPVLYMSGFQADVIRAVQDGGGPEGGFIEKPFLPHMLVDQVREIVSSPPEQPKASPAQADSLPTPPDAPTTFQSSEATYRLESAVRCPQCGESVSTLRAVRLLRVQVNFTSTLPRRGRVMVCPNCLAIVPAELTNF